MPKHVSSAALALSLALTVGCRAEPRPQAAPSSPPSAYRDVPIGLCEDHPPESTSEARLHEDFAALKQAGVSVLRVSFGWDDLEPERDSYDFAPVDQLLRVAEAAGVRLVPYVCYTPAWLAPEGVAPSDVYRAPPREPAQFEELMALLSERYRGRFTSWELWNEPDNREYWLGTPAEYATLLAAGARGVRRGDPGARVVLGGIAGHLDFLEELLVEHGAARSVDVVNLHSYAETWNGEALEGIPDYLARAAALVRTHGEGEPLWLAEVGYSSFRRERYVSDWYSARFDFEHTARFQASALVRVLALSRSVPELELLAWYELRDLPPGTEVIGDQNNRHLGVLTPAGEPKPAYQAMRRVAPLLRGPMRPLDVEVRASAPDAAPIEAYAYQRQDGRCIVVTWLPTQRLRAASDRTEVRFALPASTSSAGARVLDEVGSESPTLPLDARTPILTSPLDLTAERTQLIVIEDCR